MAKSTNFSYYGAGNVYGALFFQSPEVLMYGEQYKHLSSDIKLAYMVLKGRLEYSLRDSWVDEKEYVYFIFTVRGLQDLFNCTTGRAVKIKKELQTANLLRQIQMGFNPETKKNEPNRLYLSKLDAKATDVYLRSEYGQREPKTLATSEISKIGSPHDFVEALTTGGTSKIESPHDFVNDNPQTLATSGISEIESNLYKNYRSNIDANGYDIDTQKLDFSTANFSPAGTKAQNRDLVKHVDEFLTDKDSGLPVFLEPEAVQLLNFQCRTPQQIWRSIGIILNVRYAVEREHKDLDVWILLGNPGLKRMMTRALRRYFDAPRSDERHIKSVENYLCGTMQNLSGVWWNQQTTRDYTAKHSEEEKSTDNDSSRLYYQSQKVTKSFLGGFKTYQPFYT